MLSAVHVHHGLRGAEADADAAFVHDLCSVHNVPLVVRRVDTAARQQSEREGVEEAARTLRYAAFRQLLADGRADTVATAHTLDDQAETVLMKLLRGAWTEGLAGIAPTLTFPNATAEPPREAPTAASFIRQREAPASALILRPFLNVRRSEVERFLRERGQPWREDSSNQDRTLTRNRVRHELLPVLRTFNPAVDETLARLADIARDDEAFWQAETARILPGITLPGKPVRGGGRAVSTVAGERSVALEIERLKAQPPALRRRLMRAAAASLGSRLSADETGKLLALAGLIESPGVTARNGARLELAAGLRAERSLRELRLSRQQESAIP